MVNVAIVEVPSRVGITTTYSDHSLATGALFLFISRDSSAMENAVLVLGVGSPLDHRLPFDLPKGEYRVLVFDIEDGGTLYNGQNYPAVETDLIIIQNNPGI